MRDEDMILPHEPQPTVAREIETLERVRTHLIEHPLAARAGMGGTVLEMRSLLENLGSTRMDDMGAFLAQYEALGHVADRLREATPEEPVDPDCPYFGRLRFTDAGRVREVLLGRANRLDLDTPIVDWRSSPIALLYYRYEEGDEYEEDIEGIVHSGRILERRALRIQGGILLGVEGRDLSWALHPDGSWHEVASHRPHLARTPLPLPTGGPPSAGGSRGRPRTARLSDITALLDPEQHEIITDPSPGILGLRGGAGSGKTSVALHRLAWLVHHDPRRYDPARTLVVVWSRALRNYVSHVLPELGIRGPGRDPRHSESLVPIVTWEAWAHDLRTRLFSRLPRGYRGSSSAALVRAKLHPALPALLDARVASRPAPATPIEAIDDLVSLLADGDRVVDALVAANPEAAGGAQASLAAREMVDQASMVRAWLEGDTGVGAVLDPEDEAILLTLYQRRLGRIPTPSRRVVGLGHLVVDEVQDFAAIELGVLLGCLAEPRSATLAGDASQQISETSGFPGWDRLAESLSLDRLRFRTLHVGYRSTRQIADFARALLGPLASRADALHSTQEGPPVEVLSFPSQGALVAALAPELRRLRQADPDSTVAVIAPDLALAAMIHEGLRRAELPRLRLVQDQDFPFEPGIDVCELRDVKGLEFDHVVLVGASAEHFPDTDLSRRRLHVAVTRAVHQAWITLVGTPAVAIRPFVAS